MARKPFLLMGMILLAGVTGCTNEDSERLSRVARRTGDHLTAAGEQVWGRLAPRWQKVSTTPEQALRQRVRDRLVWDKGLQGSALDVRVSGTTVELGGRVRDAGQRRQALALAEATLGVEQVVDQLDEGPAGR